MGAAPDDPLNILMTIELQMKQMTEAISQGGCQTAGSSGGADNGEVG